MNHALSSSMNNFSKKNGILFVRDKSILDIVKEYGTPLYIYDSSIIEKRYHQLRDTIPAEIDIYYAVKANSHIDILKRLGEYYDGFDVASQGEITKSIAAGMSARKMSFAGPGKTIEELTFAVKNDIGSVSVENIEELSHLQNIGVKLNKEVPILLRVNPAFDLTKTGMKMGGGPKQFGIDSTQIPDVIQRIDSLANINFKGIHIYAGSQILDANSIIESFEHILNYAKQLMSETGKSFDIINLGGGFGIPYFANDKPLQLDAVKNGLTQTLMKYRLLVSKTQLKIELGRFIIGEAGIYVARVLYKKISCGQTFLIINGGMHHHLAASGNFGQSLVRRPFPITVVNNLNGKTERVNIVGPLCTPLDTFGSNLDLPTAHPGDLVAVMNAGAYGMTASPLLFLSHPSPAEVII